MESINRSTVARSRLAVLSAHLSASINSYDVVSMEVSSCSAAVAPPPKVGGSLTIVDDRTGKQYQVQVSEEGTIKATDLKMVISY